MVGLWPKRPQLAAGLRIEPAISLPISSPVNPAESAAADPPDEPPGVRSMFQVFKVLIHVRILLDGCRMKELDLFINAQAWDFVLIDNTFIS